jgi:hypothetical protein
MAGLNRTREMCNPSWQLFCHKPAKDPLLTKIRHAPMPHSIFFRGGYAIHGSYATGSLGRPASPGCIRGTRLGERRTCLWLGGGSYSGNSEIRIGDRRPEPPPHGPAFGGLESPRQEPAECGPFGRFRESLGNWRLPGWGGRIRTSVWRNQNPLPYHLATPQSARSP